MRKIFPVIDLDYRDWVFLLIMSIPAFYLLGVPSIYIWDEAVYVNASLDMADGASWWLPIKNLRVCESHCHGRNTQSRKAQILW